MAKRVAQRRSLKVFFDDEDLDFYLMMALAHSSAGGAEYGECLRAASRVKEGEPESWVEAWGKMAKRTEERAEEALKRGHRERARAAYMRAYTYYRTAAILVRVTDPLFREGWQTARSCFRKAASLLDPPLETISVVHQGWDLPGYFMPADPGGERRPTLIFTTGGEGWAEDSYFWVGAAGARRGYNLLAVDLPFHVGGRLQNPNMTIGSVEEAVDGPLGTVVDYAHSRPETERLAIVGFSAGGTFAARATARDGRIGACVSDSPIRDMHELFSEEFPAVLRRMPAIVGDALVKLATHRNPSAAIVLEKTSWQAGVESISEFLEAVRPMVIEPEKIRRPMLCLASSGEGEGFLEQAREVYEALAVPKKLHVFTAEEGADAHCQVNNFSLMQEVVYDWLDETFALRAPEDLR